MKLLVHKIWTWKKNLGVKKDLGCEKNEGSKKC